VGSYAAPDHHIPPNCRLHADIREVKPVEVVGIIRVAWGKGEAPIAVFVDDVFHYHVTFCEYEGPVSYYRGYQGGVSTLSDGGERRGARW